MLKTYVHAHSYIYIIMNVISKMNIVFISVILSSFQSALAFCPKSFSCPSFSPFEYPFYNDSNTQCGLIKVNCTPRGGEIQLGEQSHTILYKWDDSLSSMFINNGTFEKLVKEERCEALMDNFTSPTPLLFSFSITHPFITVFKCTKNLSNAPQTDAYFDQHNYNTHKCKHHNIYHKYLINNSTQVPITNLPHTCHAIRLPVKQPSEFPHGAPPDEPNIFPLLFSQFSISFKLSASCDKCLKNGSHCQDTNGQVQCLDVNKEKPSREPTVIPEKPSREPTVIPKKSSKDSALIPAKKKHEKLTPLILALGVGVVALIVGAATISIVKILPLKKKFGWRLKAKYNVNAELFLQNHEFLAPKRYSYSQVQKITNSFEIKLGQGGFGSVYKGTLNNNNVVAVKVLSESKGNGEDFINEVASVGRTCHVNIVSLVGFCLEGRRRALIYEFMPNGSLEKFIYGRSSPCNSQLGWEKLHQIAVGIARGLEYLHKGCNTRILHFDIKPHNILLDKDFCPKISDFGLAKLFPENRSMISISIMRGTPGYIAPELFSRGFGEVSHKSDVYSYGMMILEMVGGRKNIEVGVDRTSEIYFPHWIYKKVELDEDHLGLHGIMCDEENVIAKKMIIVGLWCIQTNPMNRPTITKALEMLEGDLKLLEIPPKPYMSSPTRCVGSPSTDPLHPCCSSTNTL